MSWEELIVGILIPVLIGELVFLFFICERMCATLDRMQAKIDAEVKKN